MRSTSRLLRCTLHLGFLAALGLPAHAQISLSTALDLGQRNSPRVQLAIADLVRAKAALEEAKDVYIPSASIGGSGYGKSYGYPFGQPTALTVQAQSLVFSFSQRDYIRSAHAGYNAASLSLRDAREAVAEDILLTIVALDRDAGRVTALHDQETYAARLVSIIEDRLGAGQDTAMDLTGSRLTRAQIHLRLLQAEDDAAVDRAHLAHLTGLPAEGLAISSGPFPDIPIPPSGSADLSSPPSPAVQALFANARAKREQAFGDARYLFRPQVSFVAQYSLISTFSNANYLEYFGRRDAAGNLLAYPSYAVGAGVQVTLPVLDYVHRAHARQTAAEATHAEQDANIQRDQFTEARLRTERTTTELATRAEIASLDRQLAQQQLQVLEVQLQSAAAGTTPMTPKDEQNARITERDKYLAFLDAQYELRQSSISLLRQTGQLEPWLHTLTRLSTSAAPTPQATPQH